MKNIRVDNDEKALARHFAQLQKRAGKGRQREEDKAVRSDKELDLMAFREGRCPVPTDLEFRIMERRVRQKTGRKL